MREAFFAKDFNLRRFHQKELFYRLPNRPLLKWLYMMGGRRAFLDGQAGFTYACLQAIYEYMIVIKTRELEGIPGEESRPGMAARSEAPAAPPEMDKAG